MRHVVIMAGGSGKRLWPLSRQGEPKQLLDLIDGKSLLRIAYERIAGVVPAENVWICTGAAYAETVAAQLPEVPRSNQLGEPVGRDSLNAVAWPAAVIEAADPDAVIAVITADHIMNPEDVFRERLNVAYEVAETTPGALVTFGVVPTSPQTGFGYLHRGEPLAGHEHTFSVQQFAEKPDLETATRYLESGEYWWNSGMFVWRASSLLAALEAVLPETLEAVRRLADRPELVDEIYPQLHKTSVDYAIMEPVSRGDAPGKVYAVELPIDWADVGSYIALAEQLTKDEAGNAIEGAVVSIDSSNNLIINRSGRESVVAVTGISNMAVVTTPSATLVVPLNASEQVKDLVAKVAEQYGDELA